VKRKTKNTFHLRSTRLVDYRLLGLTWGESDVIKIRDSVTASAHGKTKKHKSLGIDPSPEHKAKVALAGYRLLDPRFRRELFDRVQLSFLIYREFDEQPRDKHGRNRIPLISAEAFPVTTESKSTRVSVVANESTVGVEAEALADDSRLIDLDSDFDISELSTLNAEDLQDSSLEDAREIVRMIHASELKDRNDSVSTHVAVSRWLHAAMNATFQVALTVSKKTLSATFQGKGAWYVAPSDKPDQLSTRE